LAKDDDLDPVVSIVPDGLVPRPASAVRVLMFRDRFEANIISLDPKTP
jgi:hypothetical protein